MRALIVCLAILILSACGPSGAKSTAGGAATDSTARLAHEAYTTAINSNNLDSLAGMFTEDVVFLAAHAPPIVGKAPRVGRRLPPSFHDALGQDLPRVRGRRRLGV